MNGNSRVTVPDTSVDLAVVAYPQEGVVCGGDVEGGDLLVGEEGVWHPYTLGNLGAHHQLGDAAVRLKRESIVFPYLAEVEVRCEVLLADRHQ